MSGKKLHTVILTIGIIFALLFACCIIFIHGINSIFYNISENALMRAAEQNARIINVRIENTVKNIAAMSSYVFDNSTDAIEHQISGLTPLVEQYDFVRLGYARLDGIAYTTDKYVVDIRERDWFIKATGGASAISDILEDKIGDGGKIIVIAVPTYSKGEVSGVFFCTQEAGKVTRIDDTPIFGCQGRSFILDVEGDIATGSDSVTSLSSILSDASKSTLTAEKLAECATLKTSSTATLSVDERDCFIGYAAVPNFPNKISAVIADKTHMMMDANTLTRSAIIVMTVVGALLTAMILYGANSRRKSENATTKVAFIDPLTDISNASLFYIEIQNKLSKYKGEKYALVYFDIDNFKMVNDIFGYDAGNAALVAIAERLKVEFTHGENYARLFSDHFALFLKYTAQDDLARDLQSLFDGLATVDTPIHGRISLEISAGVYFVKDTLSDVHKIINNANIARGIIKGNKQKQIEFFLENMRSDLTACAALEAEIKAGISAGEFDVFYQPKVCVSTGEICGAEALLRWYHPTKGMLSPAIFIPVAEKNGLIVELGRWMFEHVCADIEKLVARGLEGVSISFNLSKTEIYQRDVVEFIELTLEQHNLGGELFEVEITESHEVGNLDLLINLIREFKRMGMRVSLDDFGTGYSSLSYLKSIPVDVLKLDKTFVDDITKSDADRDIVRQIISLAKILQLEVVSEGVETEAQYNFVSDNGCDIIQGYYYHKPMSIEKLSELFKPCYNN